MGEREIVLGDGSRVLVRPIREDDRAPINAAFERLVAGRARPASH